MSVKTVETVVVRPAAVYSWKANGGVMIRTARNIDATTVEFLTIPAEGSPEDLLEFLGPKASMLPAESGGYTIKGARLLEVKGVREEHTSEVNGVPKTDIWIEPESIRVLTDDEAKAYLPRRKSIRELFGA